jgi:hypothetical protein
MMTVVLVALHGGRLVFARAVVHERLKTGAKISRRSRSSV